MKRRELLAAGLSLGALAGCATPGASPQAGPAHNGQPLRRIAFDSCVNQDAPQPIWDTVIADKPDLFLFGGDNVYCPMPYSLANLRKAYGLAAESAGMARLRRTVPHMAIWDDNDYGQNDGGASFPFKAESKAEFLEFWKVAAGDERRMRDGLYHAQVFGPPGRQVQVIMLDVRWFRSPWKVTDQRDAPGKERYVPETNPSAAMLGDAQWQWLEQQLALPAQVRVIVSGIQVITEGHGWECWRNMPLERERLYRLITKTQANGVVLLSGDRHIGALYREARGTPYPLYEMTASGVTHPWRNAKEDGPNRLGDLFTDFHYGVVDVDWDAATLRLALKDLAGVARRSQSIPFNELKVKT